MKPVNVKLSLVKELYPAQGEMLDKLYAQDGEFRSLCIDYIYCRELLKRIRQEFSENANTITEFESACQSLEKELRHFLERPEK